MFSDSDLTVPLWRPEPSFPGAALSPHLPLEAGLALPDAYLRLIPHSVSIAHFFPLFRLDTFFSSS